MTWDPNVSPDTLCEQLSVAAGSKVTYPGFDIPTVIHSLQYFATGLLWEALGVDTAAFPCPHWIQNIHKDAYPHYWKFSRLSTLDLKVSGMQVADRVLCIIYF